MADQPKSMTPAEAKAFLDSRRVDTYNLLDVRQTWEYEEFHLPGARLMPLPDLVDRLGEIDPTRPTLVYCAVGGRSASAAQLMKARGFREVYNLAGGAMAWQDESAAGPPETGMEVLTGEEPPLEILSIAYRMEANLGAFYAERAASSRSPELKEAFARLSRFEEGHKATVFSLARALDPSLTEREEMGERSVVSALEGGLGAESFLGANRAYFETMRGALDAAMMFEAQALDLYMRCAERSEDGDRARILHELAEQEKSHLRVLGRLMDRMNRSRLHGEAPTSGGQSGEQSRKGD